MKQYADSLVGRLCSEFLYPYLFYGTVLSGVAGLIIWDGGTVMNALTLVFLVFGVVVLIGFVIVLLDKGLKWKKGR